MKIAQTYLLLAAHLMLTLSLSCSVLPVENNPNNCVENPDICMEMGDGFVCDTRSKRCTLANGSCGSPGECATAENAACPSGQCIPCSAQNQCEAWSAARNVIPAQNFCVSGKCVQCMSNADCATLTNTPSCDAKTKMCRACSQDADCDSGICRKAGDYPDTAPIQGLKTGQCIPAAMIAYVNKDMAGCQMTATSGTMSSLTNPFCSVALAQMSGAPYIKVAGSATAYPTGITVASGSFVIVGPSRDVAPLATFPSVNLMGGTLVLASLVVSAGSGVSTPAVQCRGNGLLYLQDVSVNHSGNRAIDAESGCAQIYIDRTKAVSNGYHGIVIGLAGGNVTYRILNSAVINSGGAGVGEPNGVNLGGKASGYFGFNTVTGNLKGVTCGNSQLLTDSIVAKNSAEDVNSNCTQTRVYVGLAVDFVSGTDPSLKDLSSNNDTCCIDKAQAPSGNDPGVTLDYFRNPRPARLAYDRGFHEVQ